jgi:hypothetical protein
LTEESSSDRLFLMKLSKPWLKALSGLSINLAAGWLAAVVIVPNFAGLTKPGALWILTYDLLAAILFLLLTVKLEEFLEL